MVLNKSLFAVIATFLLIACAQTEPECTVPNCVKCAVAEDNIFDTDNVFCEECAEGFTLNAIPDDAAN